MTHYPFLKKFGKDFILTYPLFSDKPEKVVMISRQIEFLPPDEASKVLDSAFRRLNN